MVTHSEFMQRGRDAEIAAKLQEQYKKEVSDQQWHLSTVREVDVVKFLPYSLTLIGIDNVFRKSWLHMNPVTVLSKSTSDLTGKQSLNPQILDGKHLVDLYPILMFVHLDLRQNS
jgi:hypothetical protein